MSKYDYFSSLQILRRERELLEKELTTCIATDNPKYGNDTGFINAKYARALRIQKIDREIETLKRENIHEV